MDVVLNSFLHCANEVVDFSIEQGVERNVLLLAL